jgi:hypothetical protein
LDFGGSEPFDDLHRSSTLETAIKIRSVFGGGSVFFDIWLLCRTQQLEAQGQCRSAPSAGQETKVPDTHKTLWKQLQQETAQEFIVELLMDWLR